MCRLIGQEWEQEHNRAGAGTTASGTQSGSGDALFTDVAANYKAQVTQAAQTVRRQKERRMNVSVMLSLLKK